MSQCCHPVGRAAPGTERAKPYGLSRPNDFESFKETPPQDELIRLIIGRLISADGRDLQDDFTIAIEKQFQRRPLEWIIRTSYGQARGIPDSGVRISARFMLEEAGAGLGWFGAERSPEDLKLKDSDIVEVLVTREGAGPEDGAGPLAGASWQGAVDLFAETRGAKFAEPAQWLPKVWSAIDRHLEDDNVVLPGLECLQAFVDGKSKDAARLAAERRGGVGILHRALTAHSAHAGIQAAAWGVLTKLSGEASVQPLLVQRGGVRSLARRLEKSEETDAKVRGLVSAFLKGMAKVEGPDTATAGSGEAVANPFLTKAGQKKAQLSARPASKADFCVQAALGLERAKHQNDSMRIEKILRSLNEKMRSGAVEYKAAEAAGLGRVVGDLANFEGDADVRELARRGLQALAKLQLADSLR